MTICTEINWKPHLHLGCLASCSSVLVPRFIKDKYSDWRINLNCCIFSSYVCLCFASSSTQPSSSAAFASCFPRNFPSSLDMAGQFRVVTTGGWFSFNCSWGTPPLKIISELKQTQASHCGHRFSPMSWTPNRPVSRKRAWSRKSMMEEIQSGAMVTDIAANTG